MHLRVAGLVGVLRRRISRAAPHPSRSGRSSRLSDRVLQHRVRRRGRWRAAPAGPCPAPPSAPSTPGPRGPPSGPAASGRALAAAWSALRPAGICAASDTSLRCSSRPFTRATTGSGRACARGSPAEAGAGEAGAGARLGRAGWAPVCAMAAGVESRAAATASDRRMGVCLGSGLVGGLWREPAQRPSCRRVNGAVTGRPSPACVDRGRRATYLHPSPTDTGNPMFASLARSIFGNANDRSLKTYQRRVPEINAFEPAMKALSDEALRGKTAEFRQRLAERRHAGRPAARGLRRGAGGRAARARHAPFRRADDRRHGPARRQDRRDEDRRGQDAGGDPARLPQCAAGPGRPRRDRQRLPGPARCGVDGPDLRLPRPDHRHHRPRPGR